MNQNALCFDLCWKNNYLDTALFLFQALSLKKKTTVLLKYTHFLFDKNSVVQQAALALGVKRVEAAVRWPCFSRLAEENVIGQTF